MSGWRVDEGGLIDRTRPLDFTFQGKRFTGFEGDTIASALLASGERILARSFKYHRPRGLFGHGAEEPNVIVDIAEGDRTTPNLRATLTPLRDGMAVRPVNCAPDAVADRHRFLDRLHRFLPAGFYYKTFMRPGWMFWEPMIRRMAGLGRLDPDNHPAPDALRSSAAPDVLVIGAGPAGLAAANAAARDGARVWLVDDGPEPGGSLRWRGGEIDGGSWREFAAATIKRIKERGGRFLPSTLVWGMFDHGLAAAWERRDGSGDILWQIRPGRTILATGALERPLWFADNDLPGVMSAEAALQYLGLEGVACGRRIVLATGNDASYPVAEALAQAGASVVLADARMETPAAPQGVELLRGSRLGAALGRGKVEAAETAGLRREADTILVSGGYTPTVHLFMQAGGKLDWNEAADALVPRPGSAPVITAGAVNGLFGLDAVMADGHRAGGGKGAAPASGLPGSGAAFAFRPDPALPERQWIDLQNDVTFKDVAIAEREGFSSVEHLKRYTTLGMATDQGRTSNFAGLAAMAELTGRTVPQTGTTTYRPPFEPVPMTLLAGQRRGELFNPLKRLELEPQHRAMGARFREYGGWLRPSAYGEEPVAVQAEALAARRVAGIFDASPLGKIEVGGPDAARLIDFCNYVRMSTLKPGRARYGFTLRETGIVLDDGVVLRLAGDRFILSASSGHVAAMRLVLEEARQDRFDPSRVFVHDVTANWVTLTVSGPASREILEQAGLPLEVLDGERLPHMGVAETGWNGVPLRVARVSFTGDRSYEVSVPARHAAMLHSRIDLARSKAGAAWIGLEALMILRAEKGYILVGKDTDGVTMPHDLGWPGPRLKREDEFFGKRSLFTPEASREDRRQLVGLQVPAGEPPLAAGAHLVPLTGKRRSLGFVTSSHFSPFLGRPVALAMVEAGSGRIGAELGVFHLGNLRRARVSPACALDPKGERLDG